MMPCLYAARPAVPDGALPPSHGPEMLPPAPMLQILSTFAPAGTVYEVLLVKITDVAVNDGATGVTLADAVEYDPVPTLLIAATRNV